MKRLANGIIQDLYLEIETDTAKKRAFFDLLAKGDHASLGCATAMASRTVKSYVDQAREAEALWMYA